MPSLRPFWCSQTINHTADVLVFQTNPVEVQEPGCHNLFFNMQTLSMVPIKLHLAWNNSRHVVTPPLHGFPTKWCLRNDCRNFIMMTCHYPDLGGASDWSMPRRKFASTDRRHHWFNVLRDCRSMEALWNIPVILKIFSHVFHTIASDRSPSNLMRSR